MWLSYMVWVSLKLFLKCKLFSLCLQCLMLSICRRSGALQELVHYSLPCIAKYVFLVLQRELYYVGVLFFEISEMRLFKNSHRI